MRSGPVFRVVFPTPPVERRRSCFLVLPPGQIVRSGCDIGENRVVLDHVVGVFVGLRVGSRDNPEVAGLRIDCPQLAAFVHMQPGDIVAKCPDLPALLRCRWHQHGEVGLATG